MQKYKFIIDCANSTACREIRKAMSSEDFKRIQMIKGTLLGDHSAVKEFASLRDAKKEAYRFFKEHKSKIYQVTIE